MGSKKGPFAALIERSQKILKGISSNQCGSIYSLPKIVQRIKFEAKLLSDAKCPGPLLQRSPLNTTVTIMSAVMRVSMRG